jgi:hypothetical protein
MSVVSSLDFSNVAHAYSEPEWTDGFQPVMHPPTIASSANVNGLPGTPIPDLGRTMQPESRASFHQPCIGAEDLIPPTDRRIA